MSLTIFTADEEKAIAEKPTLRHFVIFPALVLGMAALAAEWPSGHMAWQASLSLYTSAMLFCWMSCFHETAHQTLYRGPLLNVWLGRLIGTMIFVPYTVYRETHIRHHAYLNKPTDWELWPYSDPKASLGFRRVYVWLDIFAGFLTTPFFYSRIYFHRDSPITSPDVRRTILLEYAGMLAVWLPALMACQHFGLWDSVGDALLVPLMLGSMWQNLRKLTEHLGMSSFDPLLGTRTVIGQTWWTRFCSFMNFDIFIHGVHHRHPRLAHNQLAEKMNDYQSTHPEQDYPVFPNYMSATWNMLPHLLNPGCGVNAGASAKHANDDPDIVNFVADVTTEVVHADDDVRNVA